MLNCLYNKNILSNKIWSCNSWVWSMVQLQNHLIFIRKGLLWILKLVWLRIVVSPRKICRIHDISRSYGHILHNMTYLQFFRFSDGNKIRLCVFSSSFFSVYIFSNLLVNKISKWKIRARIISSSFCSCCSFIYK